jgi:hypothetical protein
MKTIAQQLNVTDFPFEIKDKQERVIYFENSDEYWVKTEYDSSNNIISNNIIYWQDSNGAIIDKRPKEAKIQYNRPKEIITLNGIKYQRIDE